MKKIVIYLISIISILIQQQSFCQNNLKTEKNFLQMKEYIVAIGTTVNDTIILNNKKTYVKKFVTIGTGLITYIKIDSILIYSVVTAGHVINFFKEKNVKNLYIRPSWADTIKTIDYWGIEIPLLNSDSTPNTFLFPDNEIDLGCILILEEYFNQVFIEKLTKDKLQVFPINSMTIPFIGSQVWLFGYPDHIESSFQNEFLYNISTFKPAYIVWKPSLNMTNKDLYHITLMESNATHGNSGGPVFYLSDKIELVGILTGGYYEIDSVYLNNQPIIDSISKNALVSKRRAGVSIIEKATYVKQLVQYVQKEVSLYIDGKHK